MGTTHQRVVVFGAQTGGETQETVVAGEEGIGGCPFGPGEVQASKGQKLNAKCRLDTSLGGRPWPGVYAPVMRAVEVSAVFEDAVHLRLAEPVREVTGGPVKLIVLTPEPEDARDDDGLAWPPGFIDAAYGSCREDPLEEPPELPFESDRQPLA